MDLQLQDALDSYQIRQILERYCRGIDRGDLDLLNSVYWPDSHDDHGVWKGPGQEFGNFVIPLLKERYIITMHTIHQSNIEIKASRAAAETCCIAMHRAERDGVIMADFAYCRYIDVLEKRAGEWRILDRVVVMDHTHTLPVDAHNAIPMNIFTTGSQDKTDPSYAAYERLMTS